MTSRPPGRRRRSGVGAGVAVVCVAVGLGWWLTVRHIRVEPLRSTDPAEAPAGAGNALSEERTSAGTGGAEAPRHTDVDHRTSLDELRERRLTVPVAGVTAEMLSPGFELARGVRRHEALDIPAPRGTPVLAVDAGRIAKLFTSKAGGLTIYHFDPAERYAYYYAHLDRYAADLTEGQQVRGGQTIGYVGTTGNAPPDAPHLHFAVFTLGPERRWWKGTPLDPYRIWRDGVPASR